MKLHRYLPFLAALSLCASARAVPGKPLTDWLAKLDAFQTANLRPHPRLLLTPPEMARVRAAAQTPEGQRYWQAVRKYVDAEKGKPIPPEPPTFKDGKWTIEEWRRIGNAGGDAQNHILADTFAWVVSQDPSDLAEAKRWALAVAKWDPDGATGIGKNGVDHAAHDTLHSLSMAYDWLYSQWTPEEKATLRNSIAARTKALYKHLNPYRYDSWNNHAWFQTTAMVEGGLAIADEVPEADTWWRYGSKLYFSEYLPLGGRDGDWHEGTHYISYTLIFVYQWADSMRSATGINPYDVPWLKQVGYFRLYTHPAHSGGIKFNDNNYTVPDTWDRMTAFCAAKQAHDPVLQWYAKEMEGAVPSNPIPALYTLIYRDPDLPAKAPGKDLPLGVWYRDSGWVVMRTDLSRSDDVEFGLKAGPHLAEKGSQGHDHPDQNAFLINDLAEHLAADSGYYDYYGSPHHTNWTFTPQAHNEILVDGKGQEIAPAKPAKVISFVSANDGIDLSESEAATAYPAGLLKSWRRQVIFLRPDTFLIRDVVKPEKPATLTWLLHGPAMFNLDGQAFRTSGGKAMLAGRIVEPAGLKIDQWGGFPENAQPERKKPGDFPDQWHLTAATPAPVGDTVSLMALRVGPAGKVQAPRVDRKLINGGESVTVTDASGERMECLFFDAPGLHEVQDSATDARMVVSRHQGSGFCGAFTHATSAVEYLNGPEAVSVVWKSTVPADVSGQGGREGWQSLSVRLDAPGRIRFGEDRRPSAVTVDGAPVKWTWDEKTWTVALPLSDGTHAVNVTM